MHPVVLNSESQSRSATCLRTQVFHNLISELFHTDSMICLFDPFLSELRKFESQTNLDNWKFHVQAECERPVQSVGSFPSNADSIIWSLWQSYQCVQTFLCYNRLSTVSGSRNSRCSTSFASAIFSRQNAMLMKWVLPDMVNEVCCAAAPGRLLP